MASIVGGLVCSFPISIRDIKGANLLVDASGVVKLADFGMAKHVSFLSYVFLFFIFLIHSYTPIHRYKHANCGYRIFYNLYVCPCPLNWDVFLSL